MKKELQQQLKDNYPSLFNRESDCKSLRPFAIECGDGWYDFLDNICAAIMDLNPSDKVCFAEIKEKFGALRIYVNDSCPAISDILDCAERSSMKICEDCGVCENVTTDGKSWVKSLCPVCRSNR